MSLTVLESGLASRLADLGRPRTRSLGVPVGGAADRRSLVLGNALLGNPPDASGLEIALKGPRLRADADVGCVIFGAPFQAHRDGYPVQIGHTFKIAAGSELHIGGTPVGMRAYLCVRGGFDAALVLASRSSLELVTAGTTLHCPASVIPWRYCENVRPKLPDEQPIRVLPGLQADWFDEREYLQQTFRVTPASNRMGLRLLGQPLTMPEREMTSEPVCPGSVQATRDGQCIILGVDGQTIGGYPKIAQVIRADLDRLGQLRPGDAVAFRKVSMKEAIQVDRAAEAELRRWTTRLRLSLDAFAAPS